MIHSPQLHPLQGWPGSFQTAGTTRDSSQTDFTKTPLSSQEVLGKAWFDTETEPGPILLPCPQIRKITDIMNGNREALL